MKEVVLDKDLPYLKIDVAAGTLQQTIGDPFPALGAGSQAPLVGTWEQQGGTLNPLFVHESIIDISGLTQMEMTFFPISADFQRSVTSLGPTDAFMVEWILVTRSPYRPRSTDLTSAIMPFTLPGQNFAGDAFENFIWGKGWTWVRNTSLVQNFGVAVNTTLMGSGEPTNGDRLYVYRFVRLIGPTTPGSAELGAGRLVISGQLKEEAEYAQLMRMRRTYELQQEPDVD